MLDIKFIRTNPEVVKQAIADKGIELDLDHFLALDKQRLELLQALEISKATKNQNSKKIVNASDDEKAKILEEMKALDVTADINKAEYKQVNAEYEQLMWLMPQIPEPDSIVGGEDANEVIATEGEIPKFEFEPKSHIELGKLCDIIDFEQGVNVVGNRGYYLKNELARMEMALMQYALDFLQQRGFTVMSVPVMALDRYFYGTGHFPFGQDEVFVAKDKEREFNLIGTSEISLLAYFADKILSEEELPIKVTAFSPCFRTEVGSYGKDTKGLYRVRQFYKVEQLVIAKADMAENEILFNELLDNGKDFLRSLELPFHVLKTATGDMGAGKYRMYDLEAWMPSRDSYGELGSCSTLLDWQARRSNIKYKDKDGNKHYAYTLNNTLVATPRIFIPLLELNQDKDGNIAIPPILHSYMSGIKSIPKRN